jgi:hypothetical protein
MTPNEKLRGALKGLRALHVQLQNTPALVISVCGAQVNLPAAQLRDIIRAIQYAADEFSGIECRARTYDASAFSLKTDWHGHWRRATLATTHELYGHTLEYVSTIDEAFGGVAEFSPADIHNDPAGCQRDSEPAKKDK